MVSKLINDFSEVGCSSNSIRVPSPENKKSCFLSLFNSNTPKVDSKSSEAQKQIFLEKTIDQIADLQHGVYKDRTWQHLACRALVFVLGAILCFGGVFGAVFIVFGPSGFWPFYLPAFFLLAGGLSLPGIGVVCHSLNATSVNQRQCEFVNLRKWMDSDLRHAVFVNDTLDLKIQQCDKMLKRDSFIKGESTDSQWIQEKKEGYLWLKKALTQVEIQKENLEKQRKEAQIRHQERMISDPIYEAAVNQDILDCNEALERNQKERNKICHRRAELIGKTTT